LLRDFNNKIGEESMINDIEEPEIFKATLKVSGLLLAVLILLSSMTNTYSFPVINDLRKRHEVIK
jgi:hypothetical protein